MSVTALRAAASWIGHWPKTINTTAQAVLFTLANHHNQETGRCDPSVDMLAKECLLSRRGVQKSIRALEVAKIIKTTERRRRRGSVLHHLPNSYQITAFTPRTTFAPPANHVRTKLGNTPTVSHAPSPAVWDDIVMLVEDDREEDPSQGLEQLRSFPD